MTGRHRQTACKGRIGQGICYVLMAASFAAVSFLSHRIEAAPEPGRGPLIPMTLILVAAGAAFLFAVREPETRISALSTRTFVAGLFLRGILFLSVPAPEDDPYRYLWDGAVLAQGFNPYAYAPSQVLDGSQVSVPEALRRLGQEGRSTLERVNYPWLRTLYPPLTQGAFALAHWIRPWSLQAWRLVLLAFDLLTLWMLERLVRKLDLSPSLLLIYWWNPLLIHETYHTCHMEVVLFPFLAGVLLCCLAKRRALGAGILGLAAGVKLWPVILLPVLLRPLLRSLRALALALASFLGVAAVVLWPLIVAGPGRSSGLLAYGRTWEMNDSAFLGFVWAGRALSRLVTGHGAYAWDVARLLLVLVLMGWIFWMVRKEEQGTADFPRRCLAVVAALFLLGPTQFPWYALWMLPFLVVTPKGSLLALCLLLPLYYLRDHFDSRGHVEIHDSAIVWVEFAPVWALLAWETWRRRTEKWTKG